MKKFILVTLLIVLGFVLNANLYAQNEGIVPKPLTVTVLAKGTVLSPLSISYSRDLDFGNDILPGVNKTIDKNSNSAGKFSIMGSSEKEITISIMTPEELVSGENSLGISFSESDGGYKIPGNSVIDFNPLNPVNASFGIDGTMDVLLGGTVKPFHDQIPGTYEGSITVIFYYTGN